MHIYHHKIKLHDTDAAGILFFSNQFKYIHDAYEELLDKIGFGFSVLLTQKDYFLPIVHAESDYCSPVFAGDIVTIEVTVDEIGKTSFAFSYKITNQNAILVGKARTVHVTIDKHSREKINLPADLKLKIDQIYSEDHS